jgi:hypothetical protein
MSVSLRLASVRASLWLVEPSRACMPRADPEDGRDESKPEAYSTTKGWEQDAPINPHESNTALPAEA